MEVEITGSNQRRPNDFEDALNSSSFTQSLQLFLLREWATQEYTKLIENHNIFHCIGELMFKIYVKDDVVVKH